ncbi:MAG TPA: hypothetical protein VN841_20390 [Bryobacteraceae bacterium]|nr:hypothetical protein [Bryobacteraceae bacterium]
MKLRFIRVATWPALVLASSLVSFAGSQPRIHKNGIPDQTDVAPAVLQEKGGGGVSRSEVRANAFRSQTAEDSAALRDQSGVVRSNAGDIAFRK